MSAPADAADWRMDVARKLVAATLGTDTRQTRALAENVLAVPAAPQERLVHVPAPLLAGLLDDSLWAPWPRAGRRSRRTRSLLAADARARTVNWELWRPVVSITFSALVGVTSSFVPTSALFNDRDAVDGNSLTADCWTDTTTDGVTSRQYHDCTEPYAPHPANSGG